MSNLAIKPTYEQLELLVENQRRQIEAADLVLRQVIESRDTILADMRDELDSVYDRLDGARENANYWHEIADDRSQRIYDLESQIDALKGE